MSQHFPVDGGIGRADAGWDAFEVWKTTVHQASLRHAVGGRSFGELMDDYEDMLLAKRRRTRRLVAAMSIAALFVALAFLPLLASS